MVLSCLWVFLWWSVIKKLVKIKNIQNKIFVKSLNLCRSFYGSVPPAKRSLNRKCLYRFHVLSKGRIVSCSIVKINNSIDKGKLLNLGLSQHFINTPCFIFIEIRVTNPQRNVIYLLVHNQSFEFLVSAVGYVIEIVCLSLVPVCTEHEHKRHD